MNDYNENLEYAINEIEKLDSDKLDYKVKTLKKAFDITYENELLALYDYDSKTQDELKLKLFSTLTQYSGSLSFLVIQILAANSIMNKNKFKKRKKYFNKKCGIAINHLRSKETKVVARKCQGGYKLNGILTWASGYKIFDTLLIGFHYECHEYEVLTKFEESEGFRIVDTPKTFVGQSLNTVNIELHNYFVKDEDIISSNKIGNYTKNKSLSKTIHYSLYGLGKGVLNHIEDVDLQKVSKKRLEEQKIAFSESNDGTQLDKLRVELFNLIQKMITTAMIYNGGKSILRERQLQRYYRELIMFNSNGLNSKIKELFIEDFLK